MVRSRSAMVFALLLVLSACSSSAASSTETTVAPTVPTSSTTSAPSVVVAETATTVVVEQVPGPELRSPGSITVGPLEMNFLFECHAAGAGDVLAVGVGTFPDSDVPTEAVVQAFFGQPYVAVVVDTDTVFELAIDRQAELFVQDNVIRGSALRFVNATAGFGEGDELGLGSVVVSCDSFAPGLPEGYATADDA